MATVSFDERVVITDVKMVEKMKKDLDDPTPVVIKRTDFTYEKAQENVRQWIKAKTRK